MPCTLPSELLPFLIDSGLFPNIPLRQRRRYWNHLRELSSPMAMGISSNDYLPLFIWGDAAHYCKDESVIVICIGCTLDDRKNSIETHFPLVICREDSCKKRAFFVWNNPELTKSCLDLLYRLYPKTLGFGYKQPSLAAKEKSVGFRTLTAYLEAVARLLEQLWPDIFDHFSLAQQWGSLSVFCFVFGLLFWRLLLVLLLLILCCCCCWWWLMIQWW